MRRTWSLAALVACALPLAASPGPEAPKPARVAVIAAGHCESAASAISARAFRALLQPKLGATLQSEAETARPLGGLSERTLDEVSRALAAARKEYYAHHVDAAVSQLKALAVDVTRIAPSHERWKTERELLTLLAQAQLPSDAVAGEAALLSILRVEPTYQPDTGLYPPTFRKFVDGVRAKEAGEPTNRLDVAVVPAGAEVYLGGCPVGSGPLSRHFPAGDYRVEADFGHRGLVRTVRIPAPPALVAPVELASGVEGSLLADGGPCVEPGTERSANLARVAKLVGTGRLLTLHTETSANRRWVMVEEVDATGTVVKQARSEVLAGAPETDALGTLAEWAATDRAGAAVEVLKRAGTPSAAVIPAKAQGQVSGRVLGQPSPNGFQLQTFPFNGQLPPGPPIHFSGDRFKATDQPKGKASVRVVTDDGRVGATLVEVPAVGNVDTTVRVDKACTAVGRVFNVGRQPAAGAHLAAQLLGTRILQTGQTRPKGGFILEQLTKGDYELTVTQGERRLVRRFSLGDSCSAMLGTLILPEATSTSTPSGPRGTEAARDH